MQENCCEDNNDRFFNVVNRVNLRVNHSRQRRREKRVSRHANEDEKRLLPNHHFYPNRKTLRNRKFEKEQHLIQILQLTVH
ncbi:MAG: hypothetical protein LBQ43_03065 [Holosporales bacterium]|nr:hypothetical protein [Holosporales bacterium]